MTENLTALEVHLAAAEITELDPLRPAGDRVPSDGVTNRLTPAR